jgi:GH15 family glucan-1,4-alpha-glucosidase
VSDPGGPLGACRASNGWTYQAENAFTDAAGGRLSRSPLAACQANAALARRLRFRRHTATATFDVAIAATRNEANALLEEARGSDPEVQRAATESWWSDYLAPAHLPDTDDDAVRTFARRALVTIRTATDDASGAIVASVATQVPYGFDWPRDGAFINYALDLAGYADVVSRHNRFYARVQRREYEPWSIVYSFACPADPAARHYPDCVPPGTFENNYYADPNEVVAGTPFSFEIDEAGLGVWTLWNHAHYLTDPSARADYLADACPAIERGAVNLAACKDPVSGLQCVANEDDNMALTQGLQGAETVLLALETATEAATDCGFSPVESGAWQARATELAQAIVDHFLVPGPPEHFAGNRPAWMLWPVTYLAPSDPRATSQAQYLNEQFVAPILSRSATGGAYNAESLLAMAQLARARGDRAALAAAQDAVRFFVRELPTPDTHHLGEFYARVDLDLNGDGVSPDYLSENDVPHVWEHAYLYAAAMVAFGSR